MIRNWIVKAGLFLLPLLIIVTGFVVFEEWKNLKNSLLPYSRFKRRVINAGLLGFVAFIILLAIIFLNYYLWLFLILMGISGGGLIVIIYLAIHDIKDTLKEFLKVKRDLRRKYFYNKEENNK